MDFVIGFVVVWSLVETTSKTFQSILIVLYSKAWRAERRKRRGNILKVSKRSFLI